MNNTSTPIVVVAYNRPRSLKRLLSSLHKANFSSKTIDLIISIDKAANNDAVLAIANDFAWNYGTKKVNYQAENLGLRAHILKCGALSQEYGSVIVLEDDLYVAPNFYEFTTQALAFSQDKAYVGGISLYNHQYNVHTGGNFSPIEDGFDNWYFQFASSWGQAWTKEQWAGFINWYEKQPNINDNSNIPAYVRSWSEKSWLKYNISYLIENNLYFFYPKISFSTNFSDAGTHVGKDSTLYQVPLDFSRSSAYNFSSLKESNAIYDAFYENTKLAQQLGLASEDLCVDLYGYKNTDNQKYLLSPKILNFKILKSFGKSLKPIDTNIIEAIEGEELFLYDTQQEQKNMFTIDQKRRLFYNIKNIGYSDALLVVKSELRRKVTKAFTIIFRK